MRTAYVAGPMRGIPQYNFPAFDAARDFLQSRGWTAISPADGDREAGVNVPDNYVWKDEEIRDIARRDVDIIFSLRRVLGDGIVLLPGWQRSTGARAEVALGLWLKLPFYEILAGDIYETFPNLTGASS